MFGYQNCRFCMYKVGTFVNAITLIATYEGEGNDYNSVNWNRNRHYRCSVYRVK